MRAEELAKTADKPLRLRSLHREMSALQRVPSGAFKYKPRKAVVHVLLFFSQPEHHDSGGKTTSDWLERMGHEA